MSTMSWITSCHHTKQLGNKMFKRLNEHCLELILANTFLVLSCLVLSCNLLWGFGRLPFLFDHAMAWDTYLRPCVGGECCVLRGRGHGQRELPCQLRGLQYMYMYAHIRRQSARPADARSIRRQINRQAQHSTAQHSTAQHSTAQHSRQKAHLRNEGLRRSEVAHPPASHSIGLASAVQDDGPLPATKRPLFECFPYVCPEPVLVKSSFLYVNGGKRPVIHRIPGMVPMLTCSWPSYLRSIGNGNRADRQQRGSGTATAFRDKTITC
jgi:hypothetical protein